MTLREVLPRSISRQSRESSRPPRNKRARRGQSGQGNLNILCTAERGAQLLARAWEAWQRIPDGLPGYDQPGREGTLMVRPVWSGSISFGLVAIPVKAITAQSPKDVRFDMLHRACHSRL